MAARTPSGLHIALNRLFAAHDLIAIQYEGECIKPHSQDLASQIMQCFNLYAARTQSHPAPFLVSSRTGATIHDEKLQSALVHVLAQHCFDITTESLGNHAMVPGRRSPPSGPSLPRLLLLALSLLPIAYAWWNLESKPRQEFQPNSILE